MVFLLVGPEVSEAKQLNGRLDLCLLHHHHHKADFFKDVQLIQCKVDKVHMRYHRDHCICVAGIVKDLKKTTF